MICPDCHGGMPDTVFGQNDHIRQCTQQDPGRLARLILDREDYLDAHAEIVAQAYLEATGT